MLEFFYICIFGLNSMKYTISESMTDGEEGMPELDDISQLGKKVIGSNSVEFRIKT